MFSILFSEFVFSKKGNIVKSKEKQASKTKLSHSEQLRQEAKRLQEIKENIRQQEQTKTKKKAGPSLSEILKANQ